MSKIEISSADNQYFTSYFDEELKLYEIIWHKASENIEDEEYKKLMLEDRNVVLEKCDEIHFTLINIKNRLDTMTPDLQEWASENITGHTLKKYQILKIAVVTSEDFGTQFSIEQALEEDEIEDGVIRYFQNEQDAKAWLLGL